MIKSMTGFGKSNYISEDLNIEVEIKSLNSKNYDLKIKSPNLPAEKEIAIRNIIYKKLFRGKIECNIKLQLNTKYGEYKINEKMFDNYYNQFSELTNKYGNSIEEVNFYEILMNLPEIIEHNDNFSQEVWNLIINLIDKTTEKLTKFRIQEGKSTEKDLIKYLTNIENYLSEVSKYEPERIKNLKNKIYTAFNENKLELENEKLEKELIYYLEKFDISEEKSRLKNHIIYFKKTLKEKYPGKKLNFISQEMLREMNTMGAKANHFDIQHLVVSMKDELEKIKEQVLNIL